MVKAFGGRGSTARTQLRELTALLQIPKLVEMRLAAPPKNPTPALVPSGLATRPSRPPVSALRDSIDAP